VWDRYDDSKGGQEPRIIGLLLSGHTDDAGGRAVDPNFPMVNARYKPVRQATGRSSENSSGVRDLYRAGSLIKWFSKPFALTTR
jgi:hypothetical protein